VKEFPVTSEIVIIGSGITGLTLAQHLKEKGIECLIADKGRYPGGRMAAREIGQSGLVNTGPSYFLTDNSISCKTIENVCRNADLAEKVIKPLTDQKRQELSGYLDTFEIYEPVSSFRTFSKAISENLNLFQSLELHEIIRSHNKWLLKFQSASQEGLIEIHAENVILTMPPPQIAEILTRSHLEQLLPSGFEAFFSYERSLVGIFEIQKPDRAAISPEIQPIAHPNIRRLLQSKNISSSIVTIYIESTDNFACRYWDAPKARVLEQFRAIMEENWPGVQVMASDFHRWKYARLKPEAAAFERPLKLTDKPLLIIAGEGFGKKEAYPAGLISAQHSAKLTTELLTGLRDQ
jgi:renalase